MVDAWINFTRLNADLLALAARSVGLGCAVFGTGMAWVSWSPTFQTTDLRALGLDRMPASGRELRSAYRRAAEAAHPDLGGSAEAFRAITEAFERLAGTRAQMA